MYLAAIFLPFLNFCFCCIYGRFLGRVGVTQLSILLLGLSFLFSIIGFGSICSGNETYYIDITS
jgi:NADH:ubiquinone oxidoreductase subunit 5 (subunit L)/multisubunit Na+/H+ antiporter MnhA subunit